MPLLAILTTRMPLSVEYNGEMMYSIMDAWKGRPENGFLTHDLRARVPRFNTTPVVH